MRRPLSVLFGPFFLAIALGASAPDSAAPTCLGKPATIVATGNVRGTAHADVIVAGPGADRIRGGGGNDRICAGGGDDRIEGEVGSDRIDAGPGDDVIDGGNGSDFVLGGAGGDTLVGRRGNDRLFGGSGSRDFVDGGLGDDTVSGGAGGFDQVIGGIGNDQLFGGAGDGDLLRADLGRDLIDGGPGAHDTASFALSGQAGVIFGGTGVRVELAAGRVEGDGTDTLRGIEDVVGTPFADTISGDAEGNVLYGGGGIDDLIGVGPGDSAFGGSGLDRCREVDEAQSCELSGATGYPAPGEASFLEVLNGAVRKPTLEVDLAGGAAAASLTAVVDRPYALYERPGVDVSVSFAEGAWLLSEHTIPITVGDGCRPLSPETVRCPVSATPEAVFLNGSSGDDTLAIDPSVPATASALIVGDLGTDTITGGPGDDSLDGSPSDTSLPHDVLRGGPGDDALTYGASLAGESGSDLLIASPCQGEAIDGGAGVDSVSFARSKLGVEATIGGIAGFTASRDGSGPPTSGCPGVHGFAPTSIGTSIESIEGSPGDDILVGDAGRNILLGRGGDDELHGRGGNDFLVGGEGRDSLFGDSGEDRLYAADGLRDRLIDCGDPSQGVAFIDPLDIPPRHCPHVGLR